MDGGGIGELIIDEWVGVWKGGGVDRWVDRRRCRLMGGRVSTWLDEITLVYILLTGPSATDYSGAPFCDFLPL